MFLILNHFFFAQMDYGLEYTAECEFPLMPEFFFPHILNEQLDATHSIYEWSEVRENFRIKNSFSYFSTRNGIETRGIQRYHAFIIRLVKPCPNTIASIKLKSA